MRLVALAMLAAISVSPVFAQSLEPPAPTPGIAVPDWALPQSANHRQVPPPADFHRPSVIFSDKVGAFDAQADVGGPLVPGSASYDATNASYTISSAGYNIWYQRDEFRYLWKKASGDFSLAGDVTFPKEDGFGDRKVVIVFRQNLEDDAKSAMVGQHGAGMIHLAYRSDAGVMMKDLEYRFAGQLTGVHAKRIGIEKHGDSFAIFISLQGEPMHQFGPPITLHFDEPFYVGIGFCSHLPATVDTAVVSNVVFENSAGKVH
jgi:hypothetical protein